MATNNNIFTRTFKKLRIVKINREMLIFFIFVCVAVCFWFVQVFKDQTTLSVDYNIELKDVPGSAIITSNIPSTINVTIQGRGYALIEYLIKHRSKSIKIDYANIPKVGGVLTIDNYVWKKAFAKEFNHGVSILSINPSTIEVYTSTGTHKQIPVIFNGKVTTDPQYILCDVEIQPKYVDVYAPADRFDTIKVAYTESLRFKDLKDTITTKIALSTAKGIKYVPDTVEVKICVDLYTTKKIKVPIYCENIPQNKILRTFPLTAEVTFNVSATMYPNITADDFLAIVDYNSIKPEDKKCRLQLKGQPNGINNVKLTPEFLDYVIEQE